MTETNVGGLSERLGGRMTCTHARVHYDQYARTHDDEDDKVFRDDDVRRVARPASSHFRVPDG